MRVRQFTIIEFLIALACVLVVLRLVFADVLGSYERRLFDAIGLRGDAKLLVGVPLAIGTLLALWSRERLTATTVPTWLVWSGICVIVVGTGTIAWLLAA
jgi:hypothetical protein